MVRILSAVLAAAALCSSQSGCCCCRAPLARLGLAAAMNQGGPPVVIQPPPIVVQPPNPGQPGQPPPIVINPPPFPGQQAPYVYSQRTGQLTFEGKVLANGYSGKGAARNNPAMQNVPRTGPIPAGDYIITAPGKHNDFRIKADMIGLLPAGANTFGRFPGEIFGMIAETNPPGNPPDGCFIVLPAQVFNTMRADPLMKVQVVP